MAFSGKIIERFMAEMGEHDCNNFSSHLSHCRTIEESFIHLPSTQLRVNCSDTHKSSFGVKRASSTFRVKTAKTAK